MSNPSDLPYFIIHAPSAAKLYDDYQGRPPTVDTASGVRITDALGLSRRIGVVYESLPPGTRSSNPHAHKTEDELITCISGKGILWQNGQTYPFLQGDTAGWRAGTGITHNVMNDTLASESPEDLVTLVVGERRSAPDHPDRDQVIYPLNPEREKSFAKVGRFWENAPQVKLEGNHPGEPAVTLDGRKHEVPALTHGPLPENVLNLSEQGTEDSDGRRVLSLHERTGLSGRFSVVLEDLPIGTQSEDQRTDPSAETVVYVLKGRGELRLSNRAAYPIKAGDAIGFKGDDGLKHTIVSSGGDRLQLWRMTEVTRHR